MENKRGESMNEKNTDHLLKLIDDLIKLVGKNTDNINRLAEEIKSSICFFSFSLSLILPPLIFPMI